MRIAILVLLAAFAARADTESAPVGTVIALNKGGASATLIDCATGRSVATLTTGSGPHEVAVSPDGTTAVVANYGWGQRQPGRTLTVFDLEARKVAKTIDLGQYRMPHGIMYFPDGKHVAVTVEGNKALIVVDVAKGAVLYAVPTEQNVSHMVALSPKADRAYVANIWSSSLTIIDLAARKRLKNLPTGRGAEGVDVSPDGKEVWVTNRGAGTVSVVDTTSLEVVANLKCDGFPIRAKFTPDGKHVLVSCAKKGDVAVFSAKTRKLATRVSMAQENAEEKGNMFRAGGPAPIGMVIPPDGRHAYVANGSYDHVAVIDLKTWKIVARHKTGRQPDGLAFSKLALAE